MQERALPEGQKSQNAKYQSLDTDRAKGVIRDRANAFSQDGGLCVLYGNIAEDGCVVKTAGVEAGMLGFKQREFFEVTSAAEREAPKVSFNAPPAPTA